MPSYISHVPRGWQTIVLAYQVGRSVNLVMVKIFFGPHLLLLKNITVYYLSNKDSPEILVNKDRTSKKKPLPVLPLALA